MAVQHPPCQSYWYDYVLEDCFLFTDYDCGSSSRKLNNFPTKSACERICKKSDPCRLPKIETPQKVLLSVSKPPGEGGGGVMGFVPSVLGAVYGGLSMTGYHKGSVKITIEIKKRSLSFLASNYMFEILFLSFRVKVLPILRHQIAF